MTRIIARCGLICTDCPAYQATQADDDRLRAETAAKWSKEFGGTFQPEEINCDGCLSTGERVFRYCKECAIRLCGGERALENCGLCQDYACEKLTNFFAQAPAAKVTLDEVACGKKA